MKKTRAQVRDEAQKEGMTLVAHAVQDMATRWQGKLRVRTYTTVGAILLMELCTVTTHATYRNAAWHIPWFGSDIGWLNWWHVASFGAHWPIACVALWWIVGRPWKSLRAACIWSGTGVVSWGIWQVVKVLVSCDGPELTCKVLGA